MSVLAQQAEPNDEPANPALDVAGIYADYAQFLWRNLHRMGVAEHDLPDAMQEVILVVHRRLDSFDGSAKLSTWLFGICLRVAAGMRRKRARRPESLVATSELQLRLVDQNHPEQLMAKRDAQRRLCAALDCLDPEKRSLLTLFEIEDMPCSKIAELFAVPVGTVHSRLHAARRLFKQALQRLDAQEEHAQRVRGGRA